jgi:hypothetical protein
MIPASYLQSKKRYLTSAPKPKRKPSLKRVLALWNTHAASTFERKDAAAAWTQAHTKCPFGTVQNKRTLYRSVSLEERKMENNGK